MNKNDQRIFPNQTKVDVLWPTCTIFLSFTFIDYEKDNDKDDTAFVLYTNTNKAAMAMGAKFYSRLSLLKCIRQASDSHAVQHRIGGLGCKRSGLEAEAVSPNDLLHPRTLLFLCAVSLECFKVSLILR